ncbi:hypothetical protein OPQ81_000613 [Rhizoctonia solani]|nr:hypothetical protein OPQ81_000613 [Rhizoctonia solani]
MPPHQKRARPTRGPPKQYTMDDFVEPPSKRKRPQDDEYEPNELSSPEDHEMDIDATPEAESEPEAEPNSSRFKSRAKQPKGVRRAARTKKVKALGPINRDTLRILMEHSAAQRRSRTPGSDTSGASTANTTTNTTGSPEDDGIIYISD